MLKTLLSFFVLVVASTCSLAQSGVADLMAALQRPQSLSPSAITPEWKAMRISTIGSADAFSWLPIMVGVGFASRNSNREAEALRLLGLFWTQGESVRAGGNEYLVGYRLDLGIPPFVQTAGQRPNGMSVNLKLNLVNVATISNLGPEPDMTPDLFRKILKDSGVGVNDPDAMAIGVDKASTTAMMLPAMMQARPAADSARSLSYIKQAGLSVVMLTADSDDVLPLVQSTGGLIKCAFPYSKQIGIWWTANGGRVLFNMALAGVSLVQIENPARTVMLYNSVANRDGSREVGFADGSAKRVTAAEWDKLKKQLTQKWPRTAKKSFPASYGAEYNRPTPPDDATPR